MRLNQIDVNINFMKKKNTFRFSVQIAVFLMLCTTLKSLALNYTINFTGTGASTAIENVVVQNLTKGTYSVTVPTGNALNLVLENSTSIQENINSNSSLIINQNLMTGKSTVSFLVKKQGVTHLDISGIDGRKVVNCNKSLNEGRNYFEIGLPQGMFILQVQGPDFTYSCKIINSLSIYTNPSIDFKNHEYTPHTSQKSKEEVTGLTSMYYAIGDQLLYKATSGKYSTIVTDIPNGNKIINFDFVGCEDASGNNYSVVTIGTQTWMAENLRTAKYNDNNVIVNTTANALWVALISGSWCYYNNDKTYESKYGKLYNWYAVNDNRGIAPLGWHIASDAEWTTLTNNISKDLGKTGSISKALASTTIDWDNSSIVGTPGNLPYMNNHSGFSSQPGGSRTFSSGAFGYAKTMGNWWTSTVDIYYPLDKFITYGDDFVGNSSHEKYCGLSVRCIMNTDLPKMPTISTKSVSNITSNSATSGGNIISTGGSNITTSGVCWTTSTNPTINDFILTNQNTTDSSYINDLSELLPNTTYLLRAYATNSYGTTYGNLVSFTTSLGPSTPPIISTAPVSGIFSTKAASGGSIISDGGAAITSSGICWSTSTNPTIADFSTTNTNLSGIYTSIMTGLLPNTTYNVRAYATNSVGTTYGNLVSFTTATTTSPTIVYDIDNNMYHTVTIGTQTWLVENLRTTRYRNGDVISNVINNLSWTSAVSGAWCYYNNDATNGSKYGKLYNWYAANDSRKIAPIGWHIPTDYEWEILEKYESANFGNSISVAKALAATTDWTTSYNVGSIGNDILQNNYSGFNSLPAGYRSSNAGVFYSIGDWTYYWSSDSAISPQGWCKRLIQSNSVVEFIASPRISGYSIRCVKD